jgi:hypothetical protein
MQFRHCRIMENPETAGGKPGKIAAHALDRVGAGLFL